MPCHSNCQDTPTPWGRRPPNGGHTGSGRAPDPAGSHLGVSAAPRSGPEGESPPWGHVSSPIPRPCSISGEGSCAGGKARCTELAGWKQGHGAVGAVRSHACPPLPGNPLAISTGGHTRCLGGGAAGAPMLLSPPADQECSVGLCDHSILFFTDLDLRGGGAQHQPPLQHSPAGGYTVLGDDATTTKCSQPCCHSTPQGSSPLGLHLTPHPREADGDAVAREGFAPHPQGFCSKCIPQQGCPGDRALAVAPPRSTRVLRVPPSPRAPSLAPPGRKAAPVPLAQAAARGRWPWQSRRHPWLGEDAEWHRLR